MVASTTLAFGLKQRLITTPPPWAEFLSIRSSLENELATHLKFES